MKPGDVRYIALADAVERVVIVERGDMDLNFKPGHRPVDPYVVRGADTSTHASTDEFVIAAADLFVDPAAAAIESARLAEELAEEERSL